MKKPLKIGAYVRVSTDRQVQVFEGSLDTQKYRMAEFVKGRNKDNKNWGEIVEFYIEEGLSAGSDKRPQYQRIMSDVRAGKINLILVSDISRLSRNTHDFGVLLKELEQCNASYLSMKEQFDTTTPAGRLMINMVVNMAQFEREITSERVSINVCSRALRGFVSGAPAPLGLHRVKEKPGVLVVNENEAKDIRTIFEVFREQGSVGKTMPVIEALGIRPRTKKSKVGGIVPGKWIHDQLRDILSNPAYVGIKEVNKKYKHSDSANLKPWQGYQQVKASWPAVVKQEVFDDVQRMLNENLLVERRRVDGAERRIFLLTGILHCGECGRPMSGQSSHGANQVHRYYSHIVKRSSEVKCLVKRVRADEIEQVVINHFTEVSGRAGYFDTIESKLKQAVSHIPEKISEDIAEMKEAVAQIDKEISSTFKLQLQVSGGSEAAALTAEHLEKLGRDKKLVLNRLVEAEELLKVQKDSSGLRNVIEGRIRDFKKAFHKASPATKRRLVRRVLWKLVYQPNRLDIYFNFAEGREEKANTPFEARKPGKLIRFERKIESAERFSNSQPALNLSFENLRVDGIGWGARTRTWE